MFSQNSKIGDLLSSEAAKAVLEKYFPGMTENPDIAMAKLFSLKMIAGFPQLNLSPEKLIACGEELAEIEDNINEEDLPNWGDKRNAKTARLAASQGMVLLENRNNALPLTTKKVALFGGGAHVTVKGGTGSGNVINFHSVSIYKGLLNAGFNVTSSAWIDSFGINYERIQDEDTTLSALDRIWSGLTTPVPDPALTDGDIMDASDADTAIYVISRVSGEGKDRKAEKGDYYLTDIEMENLRLIASRFKTSIVVLNTCEIDTKFFREIDSLDAMVLMSLAGQEGGNALADILCGAVTPSGKLTETWAVNYSDYPASKTFGTNAGDGRQVNYDEGIYVGYRYFDSFNIKPAFEFGYGLSYTDFVIDVRNINVDKETVTVQTEVTNKGRKHSGREVVQVYFSAPMGKIDKPYQSLIAFGKTEELMPGQTETLSISFPLSEMASYSENLAAWVLETGDYLIRVGNSSRNTKVSAVIRLDETKITEQLSNKLKLDKDFKDKTSSGVVPYSYPSEEGEIASAPVLELRAASITTRNKASKIDKKSVTTFLVKGSGYKSKYVPGSSLTNDYTERFEYLPAYPNAKLYDVYSGKITMEQFVAQLDLETLATIVNGKFSNSTYMLDVEEPIENATALKASTSGSTTDNFVKSLGIPNTLLSDGPAGLHVTNVELACTAFPVGLLLAQTWDMELITEVGKAFGEEMLDTDVSVLLGPGMNILRDPLCGRNFEYFSEDPRLTGMVAAMKTLGVQSLPGVGVSIKHFAANNQETKRAVGNSSVSERTLREIYLKGFEIAVKSAQPMTVMTSYNKINGIQSSSRYDLCTDILRGEWGFKGYVMTDWFSGSDNGLDMHAGNDIIMGGADISRIINAVLALEPEFAPDGSVATTLVPSYVGLEEKVIENWNSFTPDMDGKDICSTIVEAGVEVSEKVRNMVDRKLADIKQNKDGSKTIIYKGARKEAYITLGDVQKSAMNVLNVLLKSSTCKYVYNADTGYDPIDVKPYSSLFEDLKKYITVTKESNEFELK
ncbi:glycoside hydrolase family 3 C-terminal domain-containing protein [Neobacillus sp. 179-J 1A1 HS]|uniref:glycoside hydrolase family 3 protein n=1 Tax=Neobacillus driksii TaxID=3035913 RepID=UPI0035BC2665